MDTYDVAVVGGGIAGSVAARFLAGEGFSTLLLEKAETPREKACSGIQFPYLEKLVGEKIPRDKLCKNELFSVEMVTPSGRVTKGRMPMLNFWRSVFDSWLNSVAMGAGAHFRDRCQLRGFSEDGNRIALDVLGEEGEQEVRTRYLVAADGMNSTIRKKLRPGDFKARTSGATINYYFAGEADLDPNTLYMFFNREFSPLMFSWVYMKDDWWVVGTGADRNLLQYAERFLSYVKEKYALRGEMVKKEGFSSPLEATVYLGDGNLLLVGDAAGLVDMYRGLGMDNAALSGRLAARAIAESRRTGRPAIDTYRRLMQRTVRKLGENEKKQAARYATNETLERSLSTTNLIKDGLLMLAAAQIDRILPPERLILLPL